MRHIDTTLANFTTTMGSLASIIGRGAPSTNDLVGSVVVHHTQEPAGKDPLTRQFMEQG